MRRAGQEFALRTPQGEYFASGEGETWTRVAEAERAMVYRDSRLALEALEALRGAGEVVDLYTTDEHGDFVVAVA